MSVPLKGCKSRVSAASSENRILPAVRNPCVVIRKAMEADRKYDA